MITIQLDLNAEQLDALETLHHGYELNTNTVEEFLAGILLERINGQAKTARRARAAQLSEASLLLPYEVSTAIGDEIAAKIAQHLNP